MLKTPGSRKPAVILIGALALIGGLMAGVARLTASPVTATPRASHGGSINPSIIPSGGQASTFGGSPVELDNCATTDFSVLLSGEVNTAFDPGSGVLELSSLGPDAVDVFFWVSVNDTVCRAQPALAKQIASTLRMDNGS